VTEYDFRVLEPDEYRTANNVFLGSIHIAPAKDEHWQRTVKSYEPGRSLGAFAGDVLVGCATTFASGLSIPGGAVLPMAMVSRVGVRADHTRRGVLTGLMRAQLTGLAEPIATLRASEAVIYRRFGYGVATRGRTVTVDRAKARTHPDAPTGGRVRLIGLDEAEQLLPEIYRRIGATQPGWVIRDGFWWGALRSHGAPDNVWGQPPLQFAVHSGPDGDDGFACYRVVRGGSSHGSALEVEDVMAGSTPAWAGLWRFLLSVDLVHEVRAPLRPLDEPLELLLVDNRAVTTTSIDDETWLRIVDVPAALAARSFGGAGSVVIEVRDPLLPANSGRYRIGDGPAHPVGEPAELVMDVSALATVYLGDLPPSALAATGRLHAIKDDAVAVADRLFAVPKSPWCGSYF
jgi:predicted acetyltransferase